MTVCVETVDAVVLYIRESILNQLKFESVQNNSYYFVSFVQRNFYKNLKKIKNLCKFLFVSVFKKMWIILFQMSEKYDMYFGAP